MISCCNYFLFPFANALSSNIAYTLDMQAKLGAAPRVEVYYRDDIANEFYHINIPSSEIIFSGGFVNVDHGGLASGIVKLS